MSTMLLIGLVYRAVLVALGFVAMWSLWDAREKRHNIWLPKMKEIWLCHMLFVGCSIAANLELLSRHVMPTYASLVLGYALFLTIKASFHGASYTTKEQPN